MYKLWKRVGLTILVILAQCLCTLCLPLGLPSNISIVHFCPTATDVKVPPPACLNSNKPVRILYYQKDGNNIVASYDFNKNNAVSTAGFGIADDFSLIVKTPKTNDSFSSECYYYADGSVRERPVMLKEYKRSHGIINVNVYEKNGNNLTCKSSPCETSVAKGSEVWLKCALLGFNSHADSPGIYFNWTNSEEKWIPNVSDHGKEGESASVVAFVAEKDNNVTCNIYVPALCGEPNLKKINVIVTVGQLPGIGVDMPVSEDAVNYTTSVVPSVVAIVLLLLLLVCILKRRQLQNIFYECTR
ncbi:uncharacterized protein LOC117120722 [Anneissia japonica]|uniref:uncharacterized protein LOC117120722 n=1 Tax=Anneissia japonica TaxID=1529436 RepID=UPI001425714F|nr:uncharacterized protein LOC117120722 [Anneissia japonica]